MATRTRSIALVTLATVCALLTAGCFGGDVSTAAIPTTASGTKVCSMLSEADLATVFGTDDFTVENAAPDVTRESNGELSGAGCVLEGDDVRLQLVVGLRLGAARTELEQRISTDDFRKLPGFQAFSASEGLGGVYRGTGTTVEGVLLRGDYEIEVMQLTGVPEERDRLADVRAIILQASTSLGIPLEAGSPRPTA